MSNFLTGPVKIMSIVFEISSGHVTRILSSNSTSRSWWKVHLLSSKRHVPNRVSGVSSTIGCHIQILNSLIFWAEVLRHTNCLEATKAGLDDCSDTAVDDTLRVSKATEKFWLPASCWSVFSFFNDLTWCLSHIYSYLSKAKECTLQVINSKCKGESIEYMIKSLNAFHGDAFDLACGNNYAFGSDKCNEILKEIPQLPEGTKKPRTFVPITLQLMSKLLS